ncbi:MAG TPA: PDZ domain-containing protein [Pyrinomonadaceae bacterium]
MKYFDHTRAGASRCRILSGALLLACILPPASVSARQSATPAPTQAPAPNAPATTPAARPVPSVSPRAPRVNVTPRAPRTVPAPTPVPRAPVATPATRAVPPRQVVTVVHRLTGWKLLAWLATSGPPAVELDELPSTTDAHTNIVAGYIYEDGRSVVARLPQADVDLEAFAVPGTPPAFFARSGAGFDSEPEYVLITADNRRVEAKLVGIDSLTGLTLLEAKQALLSGAPAGAEGDTEDPTVGQRVRLYAPAPAAAPGARTPPAATPGYILISIDQKEGLLTEVSRAPSGKPSRVMVSADDVSQAWTGAVAANDLGEVVGIVSQSRDGETMLVPMATVRSACERVLKLRGNAPQPWLGARADAALQSSLDAWVKFGWTPETARPLIENRRGVFLTSVAPGTPAALAGLRPGDLIAGVGAREVRGADDFSMTLKEAGVGSTVDMTVWRALEPSPVKVTVELKGVRNPALATAVAEEGALREALLASSREVMGMRAEQLRLRNDTRGANAAELTRLAEKLVAAEARLAIIREQLELVRAKVNASRFPAFGFPVRLPPAQFEGYTAASRLQSYGLNALGLTPKGASRLGAKGGMLVVAVRPGSPASASGLAAGDVIETVNGTPLAPTELRRLLAAPDPASLTFGLVREGRRLTVSFSPSFAVEPQQR